MDPEAFETFQGRVEGFKKGFGTVLFFEDQDVIKEVADSAGLKFETVEQWSHEHQGAATVSIWAALADEGVGANLQHYVHNIAPYVHQEWDIPETWKLYSQLVFGSIENDDREVEKVDIDERVKIFY